MECSPKPLITYAMCTFNDASLLSNAIDSLRDQSFQAWELLVLDNSTTSDEPWQILCAYADIDTRIHIYRSDENVGWAKGMSLLLRKASGTYATFLAADDFIEPQALTGLAKIMTEEAPDIIWVGYRFCVFREQKLYETNHTIPEYRVYTKSQRAAGILRLMRTLYYNSLFHYMRIDFLKENQIDFYDPYYSDCASMTVAMCKAEKMITYPGLVYNLVLNTSQTAGHYVLESYKSMFAVQWHAIMEIFDKEQAPSQARSYVAKRIGHNYFAGIGYLCSRRCRNDFMNNLTITTAQLADQLIHILEHPDLQNLHYYMGLQADQALLEQLQSLSIPSSDLAGCSLDSYIHSTFSWAAPIILLAFSLRDTDVPVDDALSLLLAFLLADENQSCMGFGQMSAWMEQCSDSFIETHAEAIQQIIDKYHAYTNTLQS